MQQRDPIDGEVLVAIMNDIHDFIIHWSATLNCRLVAAFEAARALSSGVRQLLWRRSVPGLFPVLRLTMRLK
jgi:hypothetical protein